ncbi:MAG: thioredoxin domain-containing protein [Chloroflexota bacterium]|nr:thioredoxin domain-containing protein [Chloroflexota bacterium]
MHRLLSLLSITLIACFCAVLAHGQEGSDLYDATAKTRLADGGFALGNPDAGVKLIEFSDFLCTSCQNYQPIIKRFIADYVLSGRAQFEYRIFPVIDPILSVRSASLVECADTLRPGQFWRAHDLMFELVSTRGFTDETEAEYAADLQLELAALSECAASAGQHSIDAAYGLSLGADATPSLFIQYGDDEPIAIALALPEHHDAIVNAIRPQSTEPALIQAGRYAGLKTFRREDGGLVLGEPGAPVTIVAFEDFLCPHCQNYQPNLDSFIEDYVRTGGAQFEFRFYPLVNPQYSTAMAKTAECVAAQDLTRFWDAHDLLFEFARRGSLENVAENLARLLNLDPAKLSDCLGRSVQFLVDTRLGQSAFVSGTPAVRARQNGGDLELLYLDERPLDRGAPTIFQLRSLMAGDGSVTIGRPERTLLNDRFLADTSLISGEPCAPPCWQNIVPGETTLAEALAIVRGLEGIKLRRQGEREFQFGLIDGPACCQISADDSQIVSAIILQFAPDMTLGDAISIYGEPLFFRGQSYTNKEAILWFYYPDLQTMIQIVVPGAEGILDAGSPLVAAYYLAGIDLSDESSANTLAPWKGYVSFEEYVEG